MSRLFFRGIYFPQKGVWAWLKLAARNRGAIYRVVKDSLTKWHGAQKPAVSRDLDGSREPAFIARAESDGGAD
jgi:hypothetical protein